MDKILVQLLGTTFGRSFIAGVFLAMATAISFLALKVVSDTKIIQTLNDRLIEAEQKHRAENDARWKADIERSDGLLHRIDEVTKRMKRK